MKVLIIAANRTKSPFPVAPLGILFVAAAAVRAGHEVQVLDMAFVRSPRRVLRRVLRSGSFQAVGVGIRNLDSCSWAFQEFYFDGIREIVEEIRKLTNAPLILGGSGFSVAPSGWMDRLTPDYGIIGEGESAFISLLESIGKSSLPEGIAGVVTTKNRVDANFPAESPDVNDLAPVAHSLCKYSRYLSQGGFIGIQTKRGCPYRCIYCNYPSLEGSRLRVRDPGVVADEIEYISRINKRCYVYFTDSVFNSSRDHALKICQELIRRSSTVPWMAYCNPAGFDVEMARSMKSAGCIGIELSLDAASEKMLHVLKKPFSLGDIRNCLQAVSDAGLPTAVQLLFGGPGETAEDIDDTQQFLESCATPNAVMASLGLRIYSDTEMERISRDEGWLAPDADLFFPHYYISPDLGKDPLRVLDSIARRRWEWSTPADWRRLSMRILQTVLNRIGTRPQWRDAGNYGRYMRK